MVRIRLRRVGRKKQPSYRFVAAEKESPRDGRFIEVLGFYNPRTEPATIQLKEDRIYEWLSKGAQPSDGAEKVLRSIGFYERYERFKGGEDLQKLLEEAAAQETTRNVSGKTRRQPPAGKPKKAKEAEPPKAEVEAPPEAEVEAAEPEVAEEPVAEESAEEPVAEAIEAEPAMEAPPAEVEEEPAAAELEEESGEESASEDAEAEASEPDEAEAEEGEEEG